MNYKLIGYSSFAIAFAIILGAFAAHGLKPLITPSQLASFKTANDYHLYHCLVLLITGIWHNKLPSSKTFVALITTGLILFSGSIYLLATKDLLGISNIAPILGPITPIGGVFIIISWIFIGIKALKKAKKSK